MNVLVFGKSGQVGRELKLLSRDEVSLQSVGRGEADLADPLSCARIILERKPDTVINAAAYTAVDKAEDEPELANVVNGDAPGEMAKACADLGIPFVHISTDYVFDGSGLEAWKPDDVTGPLGVYGASKLAGEKAVQAAGGTYAILRTSWVFSAHGSNFVKTMLRLGRERKSLSVVSDQIGGPTSASAIATTCLQIAQRLKGGRGSPGIYHFSGAPDTSWAGFAGEIFAQAGVECEIEGIPSADYPTPARRPLNSRLDCRSLEMEFGIVRPDWKTDLGAVLNYVERSGT